MNQAHTSVLKLQKKHQLPKDSRSSPAPFSAGRSSNSFMLLGFTWKDLYCRDGLVRLDSVFLTHLKATDEALHGRLLSARAAPESLTDKQSSDLIVELAPHRS